MSRGQEVTPDKGVNRLPLLVAPKILYQNIENISRIRKALAPIWCQGLSVISEVYTHMTQNNYSAEPFLS